MDHLDQAGGTDLLKTPAVDVAVKVYRGGGLDGDLDLDLGGAGPEVEFTGITGKPVKRHQVSLLNTPKHRVQLKVYRGGGTEAKFRGEGIEKFQENPGFYASLLATGEYYLKGSPSLVLKGETKEKLSETLKGFNIFIYGKDKSTLDEKDLFETQLLLFSTVLSEGSSIKEAPGTIGIFLLEVEGDKWTLKLPGSADANAEAGAEAEVEAEGEVEVEAKEEGEAGAKTEVEAKAEPEGAEVEGAEPEASAEVKDSIILGPYWVRDPEGLGADEFFEHLVNGNDSLAKSERLYLNEVIFKGYPLQSLKGILSDKKEEFFTKVWKPLIKERVIDDITFQLDSELREGRILLEKMYNDKVEELNKSLAKYLHGDDKPDDKEGDKPDDKEGDEPEDKEGDEPEDKQGVKEGEDKAEVKEDEEEGADVEEVEGDEGEGEEGEGEEGEGEEGEEEEVEGDEAEVEGDEEEGEQLATTSCDRLLEDKSKNKYILYIKNIYTELKSFPTVNEGEESLKLLKEKYETLLSIVMPAVDDNHVALVKDGLNQVKEDADDFNQAIDTFIKNHKGGRTTRATKGKQANLHNSLHEAYDTLAESICSVYGNLLKVGGPSPKGGRRTRKLDPSHRIKAKHDKQSS